MIGVFTNEPGAFFSPGIIYLLPVQLPKFAIRCVQDFRIGGHRELGKHAVAVDKFDPTFEGV